MKLSLATNSDYSFCKKLHDREDTDMIYRLRNQAKIKAEEADEQAIEEYIDSETLAQIEKEWELTEAKFEAMLTKNYEKVFIIYDDNNNRIGYFYLFLIEPYKPIKRKGTINRWKLAEMYLLKRVQHFEIFKEAIDLLLKQAFMQVIDVCCAMYDENIKWYKEAGFKAEGTVKCYLRKRRELSE